MPWAGEKIVTGAQPTPPSSVKDQVSSAKSVEGSVIVLQGPGYTVAATLTLGGLGGGGGAHRSLCSPTLLCALCANVSSHTVPQALLLCPAPMPPGTACPVGGTLPCPTEPQALHCLPHTASQRLKVGRGGNGCSTWGKMSTFVPPLSCISCAHPRP